MTPISLIIVEPWFTLAGHPAQSLLNTARVLGRRDDTLYLIAHEPNRTELEPVQKKLIEYGAVRRFAVPRAAPRASTLLAVWSLARIVGRQKQPVDVFFLDAHLLVLAMATRIAMAIAPRIRSVSTLQLFGPETIVTRRGRRALVQRWLRMRGTRLFLRTEELTDAWRNAFSGVTAERIETLPSLEIPGGTDPVAVARAGPTRFGVLGQVRTGKGLDWLVPMFRSNPELGRLEVVGPFFSPQQRSVLEPLLHGFDGFVEGFMAEEDLITRAAALDYLLTLYDSWDHRLEAATFYLAARAGRPVVCYQQGWCGRMVREFGCGIALPAARRPDLQAFQQLPGRESEAYKGLLEGMTRFRLAHSGSARRSEFLRRITLGNAA
jgi:hypothetical protein